MYNYTEAMKADILDLLNDSYSIAHDKYEEYKRCDIMRDDLEDWLNDNLWDEDSVTGNASGSYTFNSATAKEYVTDNEDLCREALEEFCVEADSIAKHFLNGDWEYFDVTIRCYLLGQAIHEALNEVEAEAEAE